MCTTTAGIDFIFFQNCPLFGLLKENPTEIANKELNQKNLAVAKWNFLLQIQFSKESILPVHCKMKNCNLFLKLCNFFKIQFPARYY